MQKIFRDGQNLWLLDGIHLNPLDLNNPITLKDYNKNNLYGLGLNFTVRQFESFLISASDKKMLNKWLSDNNNIVFYKPFDTVDPYPSFAHLLLKFFGFKKFKNDNNLLEVETVSHWLENNMNNVFNDKAKKLITDPKSGIIIWLNIIVNFINSNPAILNINFNNISEAYLIIQEKMKLIP